jgi:hypothetical protein
MNKKILIGGSAVAVVVLILASLSPVIGYNSVESSVKDSPLFSTRIKNAIDKRQDILECNYIGKGKSTPFPMRTTKARLVQQYINIISNMNNQEFKRYISLVNNQMKKENTLIGVEVGDVVQALHQLRANPEGIKKAVLDINDNNRPLTNFCTAAIPESLILCILEAVFFLLVDVVYIILFILTTIHLGYTLCSDWVTCVPCDLKKI